MEEKLYTQQEVDEIIKQKETEIKEKALVWVEEKAQEKAIQRTFSWRKKIWAR